MIVNEISLVIKNIRVLLSYFPEEDFTYFKREKSRVKDIIIKENE